ncbi:MAG: hypothetical protein OXF20_15055 [Gammaproteobacteria bacterium]|nr:hypothetical protein [Gammaproteobacteria bacterium]
MRNSCRQLACDERCQIKAPMSRGISMREIARCLGWSPEQIEGRLKRLGEETVGREWICRQVKADRKAGGATFRAGWTSPSAPGRRRRAGSATGSWTRSSARGTSGPLLSSVERGSWHTIPELLAGKAAAPVTEALLRHMGPHRDRVHTVTADNGKEFAGHRQVEDRLNRRTPFEDFHEGLLSP